MIQIPLQGGAANAHQEMFIQLGDNYCELHINYITTLEAWCCDIYVEGVLQMAGMMLVPDVEISSTYESTIGDFYFVGDQPTLDNLGKENGLVWNG